MAVRLFRFGHVAFVVRADAIRWICKPDRAIGLHHYVVWGVQPPPLVAFDKDGVRAVMLRPGDTASAVFAGDEPAHATHRVAVGEVGRLTEYRNADIRHVA